MQPLSHSSNREQLRNNLVRVAVEITLDKEDQGKLEKIVRSSLSPVRLVQRAQIVLMASEGMRNQDIAKALGIGRVKVSRWRNRYAQSGLAGIERDLPRGAPPQKVDIKRLVDLTMQHKPVGATPWSTRKAAAELGVHGSTISRHWRRLGLKPHLERTFKVSRDQEFVEKLEDIVGLYMSPPENALVLCCDEKSQIQALDRTQPGLPLKKGRAETMTHDDKRNGTTTLFAALNVLDGTIIGQCQPRHRHTVWLKFLHQINWETPKSKTLHCGVFTSVPKLIEAVEGYIAVHSEKPKPSILTAKTKHILAKVVRANC